MMAISRTNRKSLLRDILRWIAFCLVLSAMGFHASVKFWLGPAYVVMRVEQTLSHLWPGPVRVGEVWFGYDGIMFVRDIFFCDKAGTEVMVASGVKLVLGDWPSMEAPAKRIEVEQLDVRLRLDGGKLTIPLQREQSPDTGKASLEYIRVKHATVSVESGGSEMVLDRLFAEVAKVEGLYKLNIGRDEDDDSSQVQIDGVVNPESRDTEIEMEFAKTMGREQMRVLMSALSVPASWGCEGKIDANLRVRGNVSQTESLWPEGVASFEDWTILANDSVVGRELSGELFVQKRHLELEQVAGILCNGNLKASFYVDLKQSGPVAYGGDVLAVGVNLAELTGTTKKFTKGTGLLNLRFSGDTGGIESIKAYGSAFIDDADLWRFPFIGELFRSIGAWEYQIGGVSDAEVVFGLSGPEMTIERGHLSNRFSAIEAEAGGRIDLRSGQIDMFVVAMPLKKVDKLINRIPVVNWFAHFKDKLIRLRLRGHWSDPAKKLISKQPLKDIKDGTVGFIIDVAESGGQLTDKVKKKFGFDRADKKPNDE